MLKNHHIILASGSPRRQQFFIDLGLELGLLLAYADDTDENNTKCRPINADDTDQNNTKCRPINSPELIIFTSGYRMR